VKRGVRYDGIIMDPPAFGHGPDGELWKIENHLLDLFALCKSVLSENPLFFLVNGYASGYSAIAYENNLKNLSRLAGSASGGQLTAGKIEIGELTIRETSGRLLPAGIFARWTK
jgi:23S rRNA (cytosine1962-C5)-methyltransferase